MKEKKYMCMRHLQNKNGLKMGNQQRWHFLPDVPTLAHFIFKTPSTNIVKKGCLYPMQEVGSCIRGVHPMHEPTLGKKVWPVHFNRVYCIQTEPVFKCNLCEIIKKIVVIGHFYSYFVDMISKFMEVWPKIWIS